MASKDKPMLTPTAQSIREKIGTIPTRMATRFAEEAQNEMTKVKDKNKVSQDFYNLAKDDAKKAMEKGKAALDSSMKDEMKKSQANASSRLRDVGTQLKMEDASKKKK